ncbi:nematode fatty acid retinoid binding protein [Cooperia oncophora]
MIRSAVAIVALLSIASVVGFTFNDLPAELKNMFPDQIRSFFSGLSESDRATIREVAKSFTSTAQAISAIKAKSPKLGGEFEKYYEMGKKKVDALEPNARSFIKNLYQGVLKIYSDAVQGHKLTGPQLKEVVQEILNKYNALPEPAKADIQKQFPTLSGVLKDKELPNKVAKVNIAN